MNVQIGKKHNCLRRLYINSLLLLTILFDLGATLTLKRVKTGIREDETSIDFPRDHFGYLDEYGIKPIIPRLSKQKKKAPSSFLLKAGRSKRDDPDIEDYYNYIG